MIKKSDSFLEIQLWACTQLFVEMSFFFFLHPCSSLFDRQMAMYFKHKYIPNAIIQHSLPRLCFSFWQFFVPPSSRPTLFPLFCLKLFTFTRCPICLSSDLPYLKFYSFLSWASINTPMPSAYVSLLLSYSCHMLTIIIGLSAILKREIS